MRFTVVATGQFSLDRAFGFGLTASSLTQLSVVNSPIRPAGLAPAWPPASPAHTRKPKQKRERARPGRCFPAPRGKPWVVQKSSRPADWMASCKVRDARRVPPRPWRACSPTSEFWEGTMEKHVSPSLAGRIYFVHRHQPLRSSLISHVAPRHCPAIPLFRHLELET